MYGVPMFTVVLQELYTKLPRIASELQVSITSTTFVVLTQLSEMVKCTVYPGAVY